MLFTSKSLYAQSDSMKTFYPDEITIEYITGSMQTVFENKTVRAPVLTEVEGIRMIRFLNDSLINLSSGQRSELKMNINKINGISIKSGKNTGTGIVLGALAGLLIGAASGAAIGSTYNTSSSGLGALGTPFGGMIGAGSGVIIGGIVGAIIGSSSYSYKMYELNNNTDKRKQMERIFKIDNKRKLREMKIILFNL
ncbi:MAG TPA: hypothetical protein DCY06_09490 [Bacteroidetes bacterium]|nr:hypothetical protein [Bacteroidota bacterium]HRJ99916.1 hypothetical protein [Ignavibacteria bacterium]